MLVFFPYDPDTQERILMMRCRFESRSILVLALALFAASSTIQLSAQTGTWAIKTPMPTARAELATAAVGGVIYAVGGTSSTSLTLTTVEAYDIATDTWTTKASMPTARAGLSTAAVNGIVYAMGGYIPDGTPDVHYPDFAVVEAYDPATDTWTTKAPMPTPRFGLSTSVVNGIIYAIGGANNLNGWVGTVEAYDPATDTWTTKASMPTPRYELSTSVVNGVIYAFAGGYSAGHSFFGTLEAYDPASDTWTTKAATNGTYMAGIAAMNGTLYVIGGYAQVFWDPTVLTYDTVAASWGRREIGMPTERLGLGLNVVNGVIYTIGGYSSTAIVGAVEALSGLDTLPPTIACDAADHLWHAGDVSIACTADDSSGPGLQNPGDSAFSLTTSVAAGVETANALTDSRSVCDTADNCATAGPVGGNMIDRKAPTIAISAPALNANFVLGQAVASNYSCTDAGSGVQSCSGTTATGANIGTSTIGTRSFTVNSTDMVGN
jgi:hypothetical protein